MPLWGGGCFWISKLFASPIFCIYLLRLRTFCIICLILVVTKGSFSGDRRLHPCPFLQEKCVQLTLKNRIFFLFFLWDKSTYLIIPLWKDSRVCSTLELFKPSTSNTECISALNDIFVRSLYDHALWAHHRVFFGCFFREDSDKK